MALVRVYCGLASADTAKGTATAGSTLTSAVVDDAGRLLDVCEVTDDPTGYARLVAILVERGSGPSGAAVAADSDDHVITSLLNAAGRPLAIADDDSVDDFAERFADDDSPEEREAGPAERRAVGLARALQAGALSAAALPPTRELSSVTPVLAAHAALANGRHAAAVALREVLRELYPAALRAYPDPAEPVSLAILDVLPEPGMLAGTGARGRDTAVSADAVVAHLVADGVAEEATLAQAVTALQVAISETPRRNGNNKALIAASAETVRQAVAAVRACDAGCAALIATLTDRVGVPANGTRHAGHRTGQGTAPLNAGPTDGSTTPGPRSRNQSVPAGAASTLPQPTSTPPATPAPGGPTPEAPLAPAALATSPPVSGPPRDSRVTPPSSAPPAWQGDTGANRPVSAPPPSGATPAPPTQRPIPPAEAGEPFRAPITTAAINNARKERERQRAAAAQPKPKTGGDPGRSGTISAAGLTVSLPATRPEPAPPGSRANWPLVNSGDDERAAGFPAYPSDQAADRDAAASQPTGPASGDGRVTPPWQADDLPPEPPSLRLVEPTLSDSAPHGGPPADSPQQRLAGDSDPGAPAGDVEPGAPPVADDGSDGDLLIFAATRSAWFTSRKENANIDWSSTADSGWRAAEQAAKPQVGASTSAGLPRRVPQANLVPGSPLRDDRPLRIVRDPARIAEHTTGYFRGWRRGQEIGGFAVGGRPGREAAGGWDFSRDHEDREPAPDFEYRSAGYRT